MKYLFLLLAFTLGCQITSAQTNAERKLIRFAIGKESIWYNEKISANNINDVREALSKDTLFEYKYTFRYEKYGLPDSLIFVLTKADQTFINKQLDEMKDFTWKKDLFKNSLVVNFDTLIAYKKAHNGNPNFNRENYKNGGYLFTKPILIRNKTIGFIHITHKGGADVMMYVKEKNKWKVKYMLTRWIFD